MPGSTWDSVVPGDEQRGLRRRAGEEPADAAADGARPAGRPSSDQRREPHRERRASRTRRAPLGVDHDRAGLLVGLLAVDRRGAETGGRVGVAPRVAAGVGLPPRARPRCAAAPGRPDGRVLQAALPGRGRPERAEQRLGGRRRERAARRAGTVVGEAAGDAARAAEGGLLAGAGLGRGHPARGEPVGHRRRTARRRRTGARSAGRPAAGRPAAGRPAAGCRGRRERSGGAALPVEGVVPPTGVAVPTVSVRTTGGTTSVCCADGGVGARSPAGARGRRAGRVRASAVTPSAEAGERAGDPAAQPAARGRARCGGVLRGEVDRPGGRRRRAP